jgi:hypothetical protein
MSQSIGKRLLIIILLLAGLCAAAEQAYALDRVIVDDRAVDGSDTVTINDAIVIAKHVVRIPGYEVLPKPGG